MKNIVRSVVLASAAFGWSSRAQAQVVKPFVDETADISRAVLGRARLDVSAKDVTFPVLLWGEEPRLAVTSARSYFSVAELKECGGATVILSGTNLYFPPGTGTAMNRGASAAKTSAELELSARGEPEGGDDESETISLSFALTDRPAAGGARTTFADYLLEIAAEPTQRKCALDLLKNATFRRLTIETK